MSSPRKEPGEEPGNMERIQQRSARDFVEKISRQATAKAGKEYTPKERGNYPLAPIFIGLDKEGYNDVREAFLWRVGEPGVDTSRAAAKFLAETQLVTTMDRFIEDQMNQGLKSYQGWKDFGAEKLVRIKVFVRHSGQVLRDEVLWDMANPHNHADLYASTLCKELDLAGDWYDAITGTVRQYIHETRQDLVNYPEDVPLEKLPETAVVGKGSTKAAAAAGEGQGGVVGTKRARQLPCLEPDDGMEDWEADRQTHRARLQEKWRKAQAEAAAAAGRGGQGLVQPMQQGHPQQSLHQLHQPGPQQALPPVAAQLPAQQQQQQPMLPGLVPQQLSPPAAAAAVAPSAGVLSNLAPGVLPLSPGPQPPAMSAGGGHQQKHPDPLAVSPVQQQQHPGLSHQQLHQQQQVRAQQQQAAAGGGGGAGGGPPLPFMGVGGAGLAAAAGGAPGLPQAANPGAYPQQPGLHLGAPPPPPSPGAAAATNGALGLQGQQMPAIAESAGGVGPGGWGQGAGAGGLTQQQQVGAGGHPTTPAGSGSGGGSLLGGPSPQQQMPFR